VGVALRRRTRFLARRTLWDSALLGAWMDRVGAMPVGRDRPGKDEMRAAVEALRAGEVLLVFPEGTRTRDGTVGPMRGGVSLLARRSGAPVVPVLIRGAFEAWPRERRLPGRGRVRIDFGAPVVYGEAWEDREVAADIRRRLLVLREGPAEPPPGPDGDGAACAPLRGEGAA